MAKKVILKVIACIFTFVITAYLSGFFMSRDNVNTTKEMDKATFPVVYVDYNGETINGLYGYSEKMDISLVRENITPLDDSRGLNLRIEKFNQNINKITLRVRTVDESRLVEVVEPTDYEEDDYYISLYVTFKDLLEDYTEYVLETELILGDGSYATYYTRIIIAPDYSPREKLSFIVDFDKAKWTTETNQELKTYMESNYLGDNTTLSYVNIHSSMQQLAFGNLNMTQESDTVISIRELHKETATFTTEYLAKSRLAGEEKEYFVQEYYRIKYTGAEIYLLDYERTMDEVNLDAKSMVRDSDILLGITNEDIEICESDDGNSFSFAEGGKLYYVNISGKKIAELFSFYNQDNFDIRTWHRDYDVKPLSVDEAGNVWYMVYGYMNRGNYEGRVGVAFYYYNGVTNVNEEKFFIGSEESADMLMTEVDELSYLSPTGTFFIKLNDNVYAVDTETQEVENVVSNLGEGKYSVSDDCSMLVWVEGDNLNASTKLNLLNLSSKELKEIKAGTGEYIKPLAFMGTDFVYGLAKKDDVVTDSAGKTTFPMYRLLIQSKLGFQLEKYEESGIYVTSVSVKDNMLTLNRVTKTEGEVPSYAATSNDYISNNQEQTVQENVLDTFTDGDYETCVRIYLKKEMSGKAVVLNPEEVIYEGDKEIKLDGDDTEKASTPHYYVYYKGKLQSIHTNPALAVSEADENYGTVLNNSGFYIWYRANRLTKNQIMDMTTNEVVEDKTSLAVCLDRMMDYEGEVRNSTYLLNSGDTALEILKDNLSDCDVLDLTGCSLDSVLYYVNLDYPVLALLNNGEAKLIIGYNSLDLVISDPVKGTYKMGINEAEELFTNNGNQFISYVHNY